jgi:dynein heavy chain 1
LRYVPLGWSKRYEFGEADLRASADTIDQWLDVEGAGRTNLPADKIPWAALGTLVAQGIYGGRVDNEIDGRSLRAFVSSLFSARSFDADFTLVPAREGERAILAPDSMRRDALIAWAQELPASQLPSWLGLPNTAERVLLTTRGRTLAAHVTTLQTTDDDDDAAAASSDLAGRKSAADSAASAAGSAGTPAWLQQLQVQATGWLGLLPASLPALPRTAAAIKDPLFRFYEREVTIASQLLAQVRADLADVIGVCDGSRKQTNHIRGLLDTLAKGHLVPGWRRYTVPARLPAATWLVDFAERIKQFAAVVAHAANGGSLAGWRVWLGGLASPEAFFTATRQSVAQRHGWSLETLRMHLDVAPAGGSSADLAADAFALVNLRVEGAALLAGGMVAPATEAVTVPPLTLLRWVLAPHGSPIPAAERAELPIYLNSVRDTLLVIVDLRAGPGTTQGDYYERGVALLCSALGA